MAGNSGAIKAGRAFVELFTDSNPLYRGLDQAAARVKQWGAQIRAVGASLGVGGGALLGPLLNSLKDVAQRGTALERLSGNTGHAVGELSAFADMAERAGVPLDDLNADVLAFDRKLRDAADAGGYVDDRLKGLGLASEFLGKSLTERFAAVADYAKRTGDLRVVEIALAGTGQRLAHVFREGAGAIRAHAAAGSVSAEQAKRATALTEAWNSTLFDAKAALREVGLALLPTAEQIAEYKDQVGAWLGRARDFIRENRAAVLLLTGVGAGAVAAGAALVTFGVLGSAAASAVTLSVGAVKLAFAGLLSPVGLAAAAVGGGLYLIGTQTEAGREAVAGLKEDLAAFADRARSAFGGLSDAIDAGEWTLAWQIGMAALKAEWANFNLYFQLGWNETKALFVDGWADAVAGLKLIFTDMAAFIARNTAGVARDLIEQLAGVAGALDADLGASLRNAAAALPSAAEINAARDATRDEILGTRQREQAEANESRHGAAVEAWREREAARNELAGLTDLAKWRKEFNAMPWLTDEEEGGGPAQRPNLSARLADSVKSITGGGNGATIGRQLAFGDTIPQQQLDAIRQGNVNTARLPQMADDLNRLAQGQRLTR